MADLKAVLKELEQERSRLDKAIRTIRGLSGNNARNGRATSNREQRAVRAKRTLSPAARRRIIAAQRARWAKWRAQRKKAA